MTVSVKVWAFTALFVDPTVGVGERALARDEVVEGVDDMGGGDSVGVIAAAGSVMGGAPCTFEELESGPLPTAVTAGNSHTKHAVTTASATAGHADASRRRFGQCGAIIRCSPSTCSSQPSTSSGRRRRKGCLVAPRMFRTPR
jgi:hypothetical protein